MIYVVIVVTFSICSYVWKTLDVGYVQGMCDLVAPLLVIFDNGKSHASLHRTHAPVYKRLKGWVIEFSPLALEPPINRPKPFPVVSLSLINIYERNAVKGSAWGDGKEERGESFSLSLFSFPSPLALPSVTLLAFSSCIQM